MIVLDSSAAVEMVRGTENGRHLEHLCLSGEKMVSVELFQGEIASSFWKYVRAGLMGEEEARQYAEQAISLVDTFYSMGELRVEVLGEAIRMEHSPYDVFYLVLARRLGATLFTLDRRLATLCLCNGVNVVAQLEGFTTRIEQHELEGSRTA